MVGNRGQNRAQDLPQDVQISDLESVPKVIKNQLNFDKQIIDLLTWFLVIFQCVACRVFALVGMIGCFKNMQKHYVLERILKIGHFA